MRIEGNTISMIRGDSESLTIRCQEPDGDAHPFQEGDKVYFTIKKSEYTQVKLFQKVVTAFGEEGEAQVEISPEDTREMDFGVYRYDVQLTDREGRVTTILPPGDFILCGEVTYE